MRSMYLHKASRRDRTGTSPALHSVERAVKGGTISQIDCSVQSSSNFLTCAAPGKDTTHTGNKIACRTGWIRVSAARRCERTHYKDCNHDKGCSRRQWNHCALAAGTVVARLFAPNAVERDRMLAAANTNLCTPGHFGFGDFT